MSPTSRARLVVFVAFGLACLSPSIATAGWTPGLTGSVGGTFAISGVPDEGGTSFNLAPMWPVEDRLSFGVMFLADDMGTKIGRLRDPNDGSDLGAVGESHGWVYGGAWRMDVEWGSLVTWMPFASASWGYYRVVEDVRGDLREASSSTGFSLGAGVRRAVGENHAVGASVRYHRLFNDRVGRYVLLGLDWSWR